MILSIIGRTWSPLERTEPQELLSRVLYVSPGRLFITANTTNNTLLPEGCTARIVFFPFMATFD